MYFYQVLLLQFLGYLKDTHKNGNSVLYTQHSSMTENQTLKQLKIMCIMKPVSTIRT